MNTIQFNKIYSYLQGDRLAYILVKKIKNTTMSENKLRFIDVIETMPEDSFMRINVNITKTGAFSLQNIAKKKRCNAYLMREDFFYKIAMTYNFLIPALLLTGDVICRPVSLIKEQQKRKKVNVENRKYNAKVKNITFATKRSPKYLVDWANKNQDTLIKKSTKYERMLFNELKKHFKDKIKKQQPFMIQNKIYYADICIPSLKLIIEVDGGYHTSPEQKIKDEQRDSDFKSMGYTTLRFTNERVQDKLSRLQIVNKILDYNPKLN